MTQLYKPWPTLNGKSPPSAIIQCIKKKSYRHFFKVDLYYDEEEEKYFGHYDVGLIINLLINCTVSSKL